MLAALAAPARARQDHASSAPLQDRVAAIFQQAQADVTRRDYAAAADKYREALTLAPHSSQALSNLGVCLYMGGHAEAAVEPLVEALRLDPHQIPANLILGMAYVRLGNFQKALLPLQQVLREDGKNRDAFLALASAYYGLHQYDKAVATYARETSAYPTDHEGWYDAGLALEQAAENAARTLSETGKDSSYHQRLLGEYALEQEEGIEAEDAFRRALALDHKDEEGLHSALGFALLRQGDSTKALEEFRSELRQHPGSLNGKLGLAASELGAGQYADGIEALAGILQVDGGYFRSHLSFLISFLGQDAESKLTAGGAESALSTLARDAVALLKAEVSAPGSAIDPQSAFMPLNGTEGAPEPSNGPTVARALQAERAGRYSECVRDFLGTHSSAPADELHLSRCAFLSGRYLIGFEASQHVLNKDARNSDARYWQAQSARNLARVAYARAMTLNPDSWQGQLLLGDIYRQRKDWDAAISHYNAAARLKPDSAAASLGLATVCWENGWFDRAQEPLHRVLALNPENAQANLELADIYVRAHRFDAALPLLQKALAGDTHHSLLVHADLGKCYAELGPVDKAIEELTQASPVDPSGEIHYQLFKLYQKQGQTQLAQEALSESERLRERDAQDRQSRLSRAGELGNSAQPAGH